MFNNKKNVKTVDNQLLNKYHEVVFNKQDCLKCQACKI